MKVPEDMTLQEIQIELDAINKGQTAFWDENAAARYMTRLLTRQHQLEGKKAQHDWESIFKNKATTDKQPRT